MLFRSGTDARNVMPIRQEGTDADRWSGDIVNDEGEIVRGWDWNDSLPERIEWDGRDNDGTLVSDGDYVYILNGQDAAGNVTVARQDNIRVSTDVRDVSVSAAADTSRPTRMVSGSR